MIAYGENSVNMPIGGVTRWRAGRWWNALVVGKFESGNGYRTGFRIGPANIK